MAWIILILAGLAEIGWAIGLKYTDGFTRLWPSVGTLGAMVFSVLMLGVAVKTLPIGMAYAVWTGIGIAGTAVGSALLLGETLSAAQLVCIGLILAGIAGLKFLG